MRQILAGLVLSLLGGCALWGGAVLEVPANPELEHSRNQIERAAKNPTISAHFKDELATAQAALDQAQAIWIAERGRLDEDDDEWLEMRHLNYVARQRTAIIVMKARGLDAQQQLSELQSERAQVLASARKPEVQAAPQSAPDRLPATLQSLQPRQEARGLVLTLDERHFNATQQLIDSEPQFDALMEYLVANPGTRVSCEGHVDASLGASQGQRLSQQRARAVQDALLRRGVEFSRVTAVGYGATRPQQPGSTTGNGRVEIVISDSAPVTYDATSP